MSASSDRQIALGLGLLAVLVVVNAALAYRSTRQLREDARWVTHTHEVLDALDDLAGTARAAEAAQRGALLTADPAFVGEYTALVRGLPGKIERVEVLTADNRNQQDRIPALRRLAELKHEEMNRSLGLRDGGDADSARRLVRDGPGRKAMADLLGLIGTMAGDEHALLREREEANARSYRVAVTTGALTAALGLAAVGGFGRLLARALVARRQAAAAVAEQRELLHATLLSIGDAVIATDADGRVTVMNAVAEALTGWAGGDAAGRPLEEVFRIVNEETRQPVENPARRALAAGKIVGLANHTVLIARDGREWPLDDSAAPVRDEHGRTVGAVLVFREITERRATEAALREADRRKDEFLATLAHELRNPLAPVRNALEVMRLTDDPNRVRPVREMMARQVGQMVRLVDDLLDVSRITRGRVELRTGPVDLAGVVRDAVETSRPLIDAGRHELAVDLPPNPVVVDGDRFRLSQVVANLLNNAAKYTPPGGRIGVEVGRDGGDGVVRVRDTGTGIPADMLDRVFEMFVQADRSQGGLGIGLTLVRSLVELHGGTVRVASEGPGRGSEFTVHLPLRAAAEPAAPSAASPVPRRPGGPARRILIVDDNRDAADTLAVLLGTGGNDVRVCYDGPAALAEAEGFRPDLVILDIGMPGMDGYEVARRLRQMPDVRETSLVALTGWGQDSDRRRTREAGFDHHLVKPVDMATLDQVLAAPKG